VDGIGIEWLGAEVGADVGAEVGGALVGAAPVTVTVAFMSGWIEQ
jgi:hypothetical protein